MISIDNQKLTRDYHICRQHSVTVCGTLELEDYGLQAAAFASPPKWHLAHTSWFFETFILKPFAGDYEPVQPAYEILFNSYYNTVGQQFPRAQRGLLSRPTVSQVLAYRQHVDDAMSRLLAEEDHPQRVDIFQRCRLGIEHEKQHQELFYTDIKYSFSVNPLYPAYENKGVRSPASTGEMHWCEFPGGLFEMGVNADQNGFAYDNEMPAHKEYIEPFLLANRLVTNREYQEFVDDGGYSKPVYWLADGWAMVQKHHWTQPLYWLKVQGKDMEFTLYGLQERQASHPVCHLSGYEADAYANWANARLPTEAEWEFAARQQTFNAGSNGSLHPQGAVHDDAIGPLFQLYDSCWQWTASAYRAYSGFEVSEGAIGEYNGKFMSNQWVLRGGSCVTSGEHLRPTYRNFFYPEDRWQFSGLRLARNS
ncbi:MAG: ergothioneine biosynthesis protein EgtB [Xanthomonadales bacterium]|nr:ergothioneine biosynthesis protein EgtB [Xanthomonadales bacterium]MDH4019583.1 ergothioneine biosynthesis protein EgtB [Xanthomonadales bacterium]